MNFTILANVLLTGITGIFAAHAQQKNVMVTAQVNADKSVDFNFQKTDFGTHTIVLLFTSVTNTTAGEYRIGVTGHAGRLLRLTPSNRNQGIGYSYKYTAIRGKLNPKHNPGFVYLLTYPKDTEVRVWETGLPTSVYPGAAEQQDRKAYRLYTRMQSPVTAARKGLVVEIKDDHDSSESNGFTNVENRLVIEHEDGTLATYIGIEKGSFAVKKGETVYPGAILGRNSKLHNTDDYGISFMISYLKSVEISDKSSLANIKNYYGFLTPLFHTGQQPETVLEDKHTYTTASTDEIIQKEMSKRELKQYKQLQ